jgi:hypothetical protein
MPYVKVLSITLASRTICLPVYYFMTISQSELLLEPSVDSR